MCSKNNTKWNINFKKHPNIQKMTKKLTLAHPSSIHAKLNCYKLGHTTSHCPQLQVPIASLNRLIHVMCFDKMLPLTINSAVVVRSSSKDQNALPKISTIINQLKGSWTSVQSLLTKTPLKQHLFQEKSTQH